MKIILIGIAANTKKSLLEAVNLQETLVSFWLDRHNEADSRFIKDLKINVTNVLKAETLSQKEAVLLALAVAINEKSTELTESLIELAKNTEATDEEVNEVAGCVSLMNANNIFYRFRHFMHANENYQNMPAGIRMSIMVKPVLGKEFFELMSLAISAVNGCEQCVTSHEASVKSHGGTEARIFDAIRLVAVIKSFIVVL
jgi:alkyl hydroperoxide reductase subunit D